MSFSRSIAAKSAATFVFTSAVVLVAGCSSDAEVPPPDGSELRTFSVTIDNVSDRFEYLAAGAQALPVDAAETGPLLPGDAYEVSFHAGPGHYLSFALMFVHSNDLFYAPSEQGISLFDEMGQAQSGDVTDQVMLWDAGTEANEEPGLGAHQAPQQSAANMGPADGESVLRLADDEFDNLPATDEVIEVTLTPSMGNRFVLRIENVSTDQTLQRSDTTSTAVPVAPVAFVIHSAAAPLFTAGMPDRGEGLEALAEDGDPTALVASLAARAGLQSPLAPGVFVVHEAGASLFREGQADSGQGLEALAEDGDPSMLADSTTGAAGIIESGVFSIPSGASEPGPALPAGSYEFSFQASPGQYLSFATMLVQSNDLFFGPSANGLGLFDAQGNPRMGDVTAEVLLWNAGTEVDQAPGAGPDQAPRQLGPDTGMAEGGVVEAVQAGAWPAPNEVVRVTISVVE